MVGVIGGQQRAAADAAAAAALASLWPTDCAACRNALIASLSPGSALRASWVATSAGAAPILSMIDAAWRSMARRSDCGNDCRVASRNKSCRNLNCSPSSTSRSARTASSTADINDAGWRPSIAASRPAENRSGNTAATRTTSPAPLDRWSSRCCIPAPRRRGSACPLAIARPPLTLSRPSSSRPPTSSLTRKGLPCAFAASFSSDSSAFACTASWTMSATAPGDIASTRTNSASARCSTDKVSWTAGPPAPVRAVRTHSTATSGRAPASDRSANNVPLSAQWMSSSTIASGVSAAA